VKLSVAFALPSPCGSRFTTWNSAHPVVCVVVLVIFLSCATFGALIPARGSFSIIGPSRRCTCWATVDNLSLMALTLSVGFVVVTRRDAGKRGHMEMGSREMERSRLHARSVFTILSMTSRWSRCSFSAVHGGIVAAAARVLSVTIVGWRF